MSEQYYPSLSSLIKIDDLPEQLNFLQTGVNGLTEVFDKLSNNGIVANIKLSEVLEHYYGQTVPSDNNTSPSHYTKRFRIFCEANDFLVNGSVNIDTQLPAIGKTKREELIERIAKFTTFYFNPLNGRATAGIPLVWALYWNTKNIDISDNSTWKKNFNQEVDVNWVTPFNHVNYVLAKFITFITTNYNASK